MTIKIHADNTITRANQAIPFARIVREQSNSTTVSIYGQKDVVFCGRSHVPAHSGSVSEWKVNPDFAAFIDTRSASRA